MAGGRPLDLPTPAAVSEEPPPKRQRVSLVLDVKTLDPPHSYGFYRGVYWCWKCSGVAKSRPARLALPCLAVGKPLREDGNINHLKNRKLPSKMRAFGWPAPEGTVLHPEVKIQQEHHC